MRRYDGSVVVMNCLQIGIRKRENAHTHTHMCTHTHTDQPPISKNQVSCVFGPSQKPATNQDQFCPPPPLFPNPVEKKRNVSVAMDNFFFCRSRVKWCVREVIVREVIVCEVTSAGLEETLDLGHGRTIRWAMFQTASREISDVWVRHTTQLRRHLATLDSGLEIFTRRTCPHFLIGKQLDQQAPEGVDVARSRCRSAPDFGRFPCAGSREYRWWGAKHKLRIDHVAKLCVDIARRRVEDADTLAVEVVVMVATVVEVQKSRADLQRNAVTVVCG